MTYSKWQLETMKQMCGKGDKFNYEYHEFCRDCKQRHMRFTNDKDYANDVCCKCGSENLRKSIKFVELAKENKISHRNLFGNVTDEEMDLYF